MKKKNTLYYRFYREREEHQSMGMVPLISSFLNMILVGRRGEIQICNSDTDTNYWYGILKMLDLFGRFEWPSSRHSVEKYQGLFLQYGFSFAWIWHRILATSCEQNLILSVCFDVDKAVKSLYWEFMIRLLKVSIGNLWLSFFANRWHHF